MGKIMTRMGSGFPIEMSESQLMEDLTGGSEDAADRGKIAPLSKEELDYLFDLFISPFLQRIIINFSYRLLKILLLKLLYQLLHFIIYLLL